MKAKLIKKSRKRIGFNCGTGDKPLGEFKVTDGVMYLRIKYGRFWLNEVRHFK